MKYKSLLIYYPTMDPLYKQGDIIIININGVQRKRHIYGNEPSIINGEYIYSVDYNLGLTSEGFVLEKNIICKADDRHDHIAL